MIFPKKPQILYAPMLSTFGGGSANGFRASGSAQPMEGYPLVVASKSTSRHSTSSYIYTLGNSNALNPSRTTAVGIHAIDPVTGNIYVTRDGQYVFWNEYTPSSSGFNTSGYGNSMPRWHNTFTGMGGATICNAACFAAYDGDLYFAGTDFSEIRKVVKTDYIAAVTTTTYQTNINVGCEDNGFNIGKYFYVQGPLGAYLWDITTQSVAMSTTATSGPRFFPVVSPRDNALGIWNGENGVLQLMDYDDNSITYTNNSLVFGDLNSGNYSYGAPYIMMYAHTPSDTFSGTFDLGTSPGTHTVVGTKYASSSKIYTYYSGLSGNNITNAQWGDGAYFPSTGAMKAVGLDAGGSSGGAVYEATFSQNALSSRVNTVGGISMYLGNRGGVSAFFSHKESKNTPI